MQAHVLTGGVSTPSLVLKHSSHIDDTPNAEASIGLVRDWANNLAWASYKWAAFRAQAAPYTEAVNLASIFTTTTSDLEPVHYTLNGRAGHSWPEEDHYLVQRWGSGPSTLWHADKTPSSASFFALDSPTGEIWAAFIHFAASGGDKGMARAITQAAVVRDGARFILHHVAAKIGIELSAVLENHKCNHICHKMSLHKSQQEEDQPEEEE
ncbi:hypothetical protein JCM8097_001189 [Rhodosporidiobolus ruineniae]